MIQILLHIHCGYLDHVTITITVASLMCDALFYYNVEKCNGGGLISQGSL